MNEDIFAGQWRQMRGELKSWWGKLADDDFDRIGGQQDKLIGVLQEKYGYDRAQAQQEVERRFTAYGDTMGRSSGNGMPDNAPHEGTIATVVAAVAGGLESAEGVLATVATTVADGLGSARSYLHEKDVAEVATDLTALIRRYPVQSLLIGAGLGYVLARLTKKG